MLKAIIWDVDGTLVDSEELHRTSFNRAFAKAGLGWCWDRNVYGRLLDVAGGRERMRRYAAMIGKDEETLPVPIPELHAMKSECYRQALGRGELRLRPGVGRLLAEIRRAGLWLAMATSTSGANVLQLFRTHLLTADHWRTIVPGDLVRKKKPAPDLYLKALKRLGLKPSECLAVEDSENGVAAAWEACIPVVATPNLYTRDHDFHLAVAEIDSLEHWECASGAGGVSVEDFVRLHAEGVQSSRAGALSCRMVG